jgi:hypothetical protein
MIAPGKTKVLERELQGIQKKIDNLLEAIGQGIVGLALAKEKLEIQLSGELFG